MTYEPRRGLVHRCEQARIQAHPDAQDRLIRLDGIEPHGAVVVVHGHLDTVAEVVDPTLQAGVRIAVGPGVRVLDPQQAPVEDDLVRVAVQSQEWRDVGDPLLDLAVEQELRIGADVAAEQQVAVADDRRRGQTLEPSADGNPATNGIAGADFGGGVVAGTVELVESCPDHRVV